MHGLLFLHGAAERECLIRAVSPPMRERQKREKCDEKTACVHSLPVGASAGTARGCRHYLIVYHAQRGDLLYRDRRHPRRRFSGILHPSRQRGDHGTNLRLRRGDQCSRRIHTVWRLRLIGSAVLRPTRDGEHSHRWRRQPDRQRRQFVTLLPAARPPAWSQLDP